MADQGEWVEAMLADKGGLNSNAVNKERMEASTQNRQYSSKVCLVSLFLIAILAVFHAFACAAVTKKGTLCKRAPSPGSQYCWQHGGTTAAQRAAGLSEADVAKMRCKAITKAGAQCKRTARSGSEYCWQHGAVQSAKSVESEVKTPGVAAINETSAAETTPAVTAERVQCDAITKSGKRCSRKALQGGTKCWQHAR